MIINKEKFKNVIGFIYCLLVSIAIVLIIGLVVHSVFKSERLAEENNALLKAIVDQEPIQRVHCIIRMDDSIKDDESREEVVLEEKVEITEAEQEEPTMIQTFGKEIGQDVELPDLPTDRKVCTNYKVYGIPGTPHNRMQKLAYTDALGCRRYGEYYIVGLGSAYADRIGETFEVELETGVVFKIITGDMKADCDTDTTNRYGPCVNYDGDNCANVLEFIVDKEVLSKEAYQWGGVDYYNKFKGDIIRMTYLGRDTSADWDIYT